MIMGKPADNSPPPYATGDNPTPAVTALPRLEALPPPEIARCNMLFIERERSDITGQFVIDPSLVIPQALLATPTLSERARKVHK